MGRSVDVGGSVVELGSWEDLERACAEGLLDEGNYVELKRGLPPAKQNTETARDLASMTVLGGVFIVGVRDAGEGKPGEVEGIHTYESVRTRLAAVASGLVQPAIACEIYALPHPTETDLGCIVCVIPPSPTAPHRADDRYWGRSTHGKRVLTDPEIADLFAQRRNREDTFAHDLIQLATDFDPEHPLERADGHLYLQARPLQHHPSADPRNDKHPLHLIQRANLHRSDYGGTDLTSLLFKHPHPDGVLAASFRHDNAGYDASFIQVLFGDDGAIRMASGTGAKGGGALSGHESLGVVNLGAVVVLVHQFIQTVRTVAAERALPGLWHLGVHMEGMRNATAMTSRNSQHAGSFPDPSYTRTTVVARPDLDDPARVAETLLWPLARGLARESIFPYSELRDVFKRYI